MDPELLESRPELQPRLANAVVGVVDDDLTALFLEEVERLLFEPVLDLDP